MADPGPWGSSSHSVSRPQYGQHAGRRNNARHPKRKFTINARGKLKINMKGKGKGKKDDAELDENILSSFDASSFQQLCRSLHLTSADLEFEENKSNGNDLQQRIASVHRTEHNHNQRLCSDLRKKYDRLKNKCTVVKKNIAKVREQISYATHRVGASAGNKVGKKELHGKYLAAHKEQVEEEHLDNKFRLNQFKFMQDRLSSQILTIDHEIVQMETSVKKKARECREVDKRLREVNQYSVNLEKLQMFLAQKLAHGRKTMESKKETLQRLIDDTKERRERECEQEAKQDEVLMKIEDDRNAKMQELADKTRREVAALNAEIQEKHQQIDSYEQALQKIKNVTGQSDMSQIVHRFLYRDDRIKQLEKQRGDKFSKIDHLASDNSSLKYELQNIQAMGFGGVGDNREVYKELDNHESKLIEAQDTLKKQSRSFKRTKSVLEELLTCLQQFLYKTSVSHPMLLSDKENKDKEQQIMEKISHLNINDSSTLTDGYHLVLSRVERLLESVASLINADTKEEHDESSNSVIQNQMYDSDNTTFLTSGVGGINNVKQSDEKNVNERIGIDIAPVKKAAHRVLSSPRATELVFQSIMTAKLDTSTRNMRVSARNNAPPSAVASLLKLEVNAMPRTEEVEVNESEESEEEEDGWSKSKHENDWRKHLMNTVEDRLGVKKFNQKFVKRKTTLKKRFTRRTSQGTIKPRKLKRRSSSISKSNSRKNMNSPRTPTRTLS